MARPKLKITKELINAEVPRVAERYALTRLFEKSVLKDADDTSCQINEILERVNQAPRSGSLDIAKSYVEVQVHLALNFSMQGMHKQDYRLSTPEERCIDFPEQKYISEAGKKGR
jgi:hypothetical protein